MDRGDLPYDVHINVGVIVGDDVSHPSHFPKRQFRNGAPGLFVQVGGGFTDDFDPPDHRILFLRVGPEIRLGCPSRTMRSGAMPPGCPAIARVGQLP